MITYLSHSDIRKKFPLEVEYKRTHDWWNGPWQVISDWCNSAYGQGNWEYYDEHFRFKTEANKLLFLLRWR